LKKVLFLVQLYQRSFEKVLSDPRNSQKLFISHPSLLEALEISLKKVLLITFVLELIPWKLSKLSENFYR